MRYESLIRSVLTLTILLGIGCTYRSDDPKKSEAQYQYIADELHAYSEATYGPQNPEPWFEFFGSYNRGQGLDKYRKPMIDPQTLPFDQSCTNLEGIKTQFTENEKVILTNLFDETDGLLKSIESVVAEGQVGRVFHPTDNNVVKAYEELSYRELGQIIRLLLLRTYWALSQDDDTGAVAWLRILAQVKLGLHTGEYLMQELIAASTMRTLQKGYRSLLWDDVSSKALRIALHDLNEQAPKHSQSTQALETALCWDPVMNLMTYNSPGRVYSEWTLANLLIMTNPIFLNDFIYDERTLDTTNYPEPFLLFFKHLLREVKLSKNTPPRMLQWTRSLSLEKRLKTLFKECPEVFENPVIPVTEMQEWSSFLLLVTLNLEHKIGSRQFNYLGLGLQHQRMLQLATATRLYEHDHGHTPASLQELVPEYLDAIPESVWGESGFEIRSVPDPDLWMKQALKRTNYNPISSWNYSIEHDEDTGAQFILLKIQPALHVTMVEENPYLMQCFDSWPKFIKEVGEPKDVREPDEKHWITYKMDINPDFAPRAIVAPGPDGKAPGETLVVLDGTKTDSQTGCLVELVGF